MQFNLPPEVNLTSKEITASVAIRISKEAHISVMPNPEKIHELIESFANEHRLKVGDLDIEIYHTHNRLVIERPVLQTKSLEVTATAFNSISSQTNKDHASITAWGDELKPGMKYIAVSRDLIQMGLTHGTEVEITGLSDTYKVLDKMNKRWEKRIDIYMGNDEEAARQWGKKQVTISWR
jgi:3D (Asp-Asp-Asp) domain-containing protein